VTKEIPLVSVIMTVYNGQEYLKESIESILNQSYGCIEFIIINDGSIDYSESIIKSYTDHRIFYYHFNNNEGLANRLNFGISVAKGTYLVRMDSDDISKANRIQTQVDFMNKNLEIGVCGSFVEVIGSSKGIWKMPLFDEEIKAFLISGSPFCHPSVIIRKQVLTEYNIGYSSIFQQAEDYFLWTQLAKVTKFANINECLLLYRISEKQVSRIKQKEQAKQKMQIQKIVLDEVMIIPDCVFFKLFNPNNSLTNYSKSEIFQFIKLINMLEIKNSIKNVFHIESFKKELGFYILSLITKNRKIWFRSVFWAIRKGYFKGLTMRMYLGLAHKLMVSCFKL
jgi:glycosyltransferase involved in cell wall biosynthesis